MAYQKRRSAILEKAQSRLNGLQSVAPTMNLGNGLTLEGYAALIESSSQQLQMHNLALAEVDRSRIEFSQAEAAVSALSSRILSAVAAMYGKDSKEYEMAGGKPPSSYRRAKKRLPTVEPTEAQPGKVASAPVSNGASINGSGAVVQAR